MVSDIPRVSVFGHYPYSITFPYIYIYIYIYNMYDLYTAVINIAMIYNIITYK